MKTKLVLAAMLLAVMNIGTVYAESASPDVVKTLNNLISTSIDAQKGYQQAAEAMGSSALKEKYNAESSKRAEFADALKTRVRESGKEYETDGSLGAAVHRGWFDVKSAFDHQSDGEVLDALKVGERGALKSYQDALAEPLPKDVEDLVRSQKDAVQGAYDNLDKDFQDAHEVK